MTDHGKEKAMDVARKAAASPYTRWDCDQAVIQVRAARINLKAMLETVYPPGIRVKARLGRHKVTVEITKHSHAEDGELRGFNVKTGAVRKFHFSSIEGVVI